MIRIQPRIKCTLFAIVNEDRTVIFSQHASWMEAHAVLEKIKEGTVYDSIHLAGFHSEDLGIVRLEVQEVETHGFYQAKELSDTCLKRQMRIE